MSGTISERTKKQYDKHQASVEELDTKLTRFQLRFLSGLPDHSSVLTTKEMDWGVYIGIREARHLLKVLQSKKRTVAQVYNYLHQYGLKLRG